jgi:hypothetical protein
VYYQTEWDEFEKTMSNVMKNHMAWAREKKESKALSQKACAVLAQALVGGANSQVRHFLDEDKPHEAWVELNDEYAPQNDSQTAEQLRIYMKALRLLEPTDLRTYMDKITTLRDAIVLRSKSYGVEYLIPHAGPTMLMSSLTTIIRVVEETVS